MSSPSVGVRRGLQVVVPAGVQSAVRETVRAARRIRLCVLAKSSILFYAVVAIRVLRCVTALFANGFMR